MNNSDMKKMLIKASIFTGICMTIMLQRTATKHVMIADAAGTTIDRGNSNESYKLLLSDDMDNGQSGKLIIPLSKTVGIDDIVLEDNYMEHELLIYIDGREEGFYLDNYLYTDLDIIESAVCITENDSGAVCLDFKLDDLYVNESTLTETNTIEVSFYSPHDKYDKVVVIDPACGGSNTGEVNGVLSEKDIALDIAIYLKETQEKSENESVKLYYTRLTDIDVTDEQRLNLIEESEADFVVGIGTGSSAELKEGIYTLYNDSYFIRGLNNADFADIIEKYCASCTGANALGVHLLTEDDSVLLNSHVPTTRVIVGNLSYENDVAKLEDGAYKKKLAEGIYDGIIEAVDSVK